MAGSMAFVIIPLKAGVTHKKFATQTKWVSGPWIYKETVDTSAGIAAARSSFPPPLEHLFANSIRNHVKGFSKIKSDKFVLKAIEVIEFQNFDLELNPVAIFHLSQVGGSTVLNVFDVFGETSKTLIDRYGLDLECIDQEIRPISITSSKPVASQKFSIINLEETNEYKFRTQSVELGIVGHLQLVSIMKMRQSVPLEINNASQVKSFISLVSKFKTVLWWNFLTARVSGANPLDLIANQYKIREQAQELFDLAENLRESEELQTSRNLNMYGAVLGVSALLAGWLGQISGLYKVLGISGTILAIVSLYLSLSKKK